MTTKKSFLLIAWTVLSAASCGGGNPQAPGVGAPGEEISANPTAKVAVGESCRSNDPNHLCLALDYVVYEHVDGSSVTPEQAAETLHGINLIFGTCNIGFQIEKFAAVKPMDYGLADGSAALGQLDEIRKTFQNDHQLLVVTTGPWGTPQIAWTQVPPANGIYGSIISGVSQTDQEVIAHELGHYLGLDHLSDQSNLMNPVVYSTGLTATQCQQMRETAQEFWKAMYR